MENSAQVLSRTYHMEKLNGKNYQPWCMTMEIILEQYNLLNIVDGTKEFKDDNIIYLSISFHFLFPTIKELLGYFFTLFSFNRLYLMSLWMSGNSSFCSISKERIWIALCLKWLIGIMEYTKKGVARISLFITTWINCLKTQVSYI